MHAVGALGIERAPERGVVLQVLAAFVAGADIPHAEFAVLLDDRTVEMDGVGIRLARLAAPDHRISVIFFRGVHLDLEAAREGDRNIIESEERLAIQFVDRGLERAAVELAGLRMPWKPAVVSGNGCSQ